ncbi:hypothetical protein [Vibrio mediterranei]|uniref:hypothetical protein n=1 Tax=Vibrio mediterranei TaxID=689 RepID=UPI0040680220
MSQDDLILNYLSLQGGARCRRVISEIQALESNGVYLPYWWDSFELFTKPPTVTLFLSPAGDFLKPVKLARSLLESFALGGYWSNDEMELGQVGIFNDDSLKHRFMALVLVYLSSIAARATLPSIGDFELKGLNVEKTASLLLSRFFPKVSECSSIQIEGATVVFLSKAVSGAQANSDISIIEEQIGWVNEKIGAAPSSTTELAKSSKNVSVHLSKAVVKRR